MTLQQLKYALTIADCGSMNEAAKQLFISQPSLSETMKELETEIGLDIFLRSNRGIVITPEGEEFLGYARQVTEQFGLLQSKYIDKKVKEKFSVSTQHYTFAVKAFVETVKQIGMEQYEFAVHETTTISVIENVKNFKSEIGVLYENDFNEKVLNKMFKENGLEFVELLLPQILQRCRSAFRRPQASRCLLLPRYRRAALLRRSLLCRPVSHHRSQRRYPAPHHRSLQRCRFLYCHSVFHLLQTSRPLLLPQHRCPAP